MDPKEALARLERAEKERDEAVLAAVEAEREANAKTAEAFGGFVCDKIAAAIRARRPK